MNKNRFVGIMKTNGDNQAKLAEYIGISEARLNAKINETGGAQFTQREILKIKTRYHLVAEEIDSIFFNLNVS